VEQQGGLADLLEGGVERLHELVRELAYEADRVGHQDGPAPGQLNSPREGIERREEPVLDEHVAARDVPQQRRLPRVRVPDERDDGDPGARSPPPTDAPRALEIPEVRPHALHAPKDRAALGLELRLAGPATRPDATAEPGQDLAPSPEARLVVEDDHVGIERLSQPHDVARLAGPDVGRRIRRRSPLRDPFEGVGASRVGERSKLVERPLLLVAQAVEVDADEHRALARRGPVPAPAQVTTLRRRSTPSSSRSSATVSENRTYPSPDAP
jgi:hypothetical protein